MRVARLILVLWLVMPAAAWPQTPGVSTEPETQNAKPPAPSGNEGRRSLTEQEIDNGRFFSHEQGNSVDTDGNGTVTIFELGDSVRKRITTGHSSPGGDGTSPAAGPTPQFKASKNAASHRVDSSRQRSTYESFRSRQMNETGSLPSVAPNIIEKRF